jgi:uncharacterized protein DUF1236
MRANLLRSTILALALCGAGFASAQNAGTSPDGQVPGPNATQPQASAHPAGADKSVQPVPGAMPGSDTVPSTLSEKNAADDKLITVAYTFKNLSDEQRRTIYEALKDQSVPASAPKVEIGAELPIAIELRPVPREVVTRVPQTNGYEYTVAGNKVLLVSPPTRIVVGEFAQ